MSLKRLNYSWIASNLNNNWHIFGFFPSNFLQGCIFFRLASKITFLHVPFGYFPIGEKNYLCNSKTVHYLQGTLFINVPYTRKVLLNSQSKKMCLWVKNCDNYTLVLKVTYICDEMWLLLITVIQINIEVMLNPTVCWKCYLFSFFQSPLYPI